jgi:hypothetical protein
MTKYCFSDVYETGIFKVSAMSKISLKLLYSVSFRVQLIFSPDFSNFAYCFP